MSLEFSCLSVLCSVSSRCNCIIVGQHVDRRGVIQLGESVHCVRSGAWVVFGLCEFDVSLLCATNSSRAFLFSYASRVIITITLSVPWVPVLYTSDAMEFSL